MCNKTPLHIYVRQEEIWATIDYKEVPEGSARQIVIMTKAKANEIMENPSILEGEYPNTLQNLREKNNGNTK